MKQLFRIFLLIIIVSSNNYINAQNLEVEGKIKVTEFDLSNAADSIVVLLPDNTLGIRDVSSLSGFQILSISNDTIFLTNGGFVKLPPSGAGGWTMNTDSIFTDKNVSIGKSGTENKFEIFTDSLFTEEINDQCSLAEMDALTISSGAFGAQSFVVDNTGELVKIEITAKKAGATTSNLSLEIKTGGDPSTGTSLLVQAFDITSVVDSIYSIILATTIPVTVDDTLVMIVSKTGGDDGVWQRSSTDVYPGGNAFVNASGWLPPLLTKDHWFKSYIELADSTPVPIFTVKESRKVGIGTSEPSEAFEVNGAINISNNDDDTPNAGTIRWNESTQDFEGFNGTQWLSLTSKKDDKFWGNTDLSYNSTECNKLTALDAAASDEFGNSVSISGDYAIVGAFQNDDLGSDSGSAYIFKRNGETWTEEAKLTASDADADDNFSYSVSISGDYAIVGAFGNDDVINNSGSAYIFKRDGAIWTEESKLTASDADADDFFGISVSISGDYAIVGAHRNDDVINASGSAYIFKRSGVTWTEESKLTASDADAFDEFGFSVSINGDYAIVGALKNDDVPNNSGSAYIFNRSGVTWTEESKLTASDADAGDNFGVSVSISGDYAIVGAFQNDDGANNSTGSAYIFKLSGAIWTQETILTASDANAFDLFGFSVSINGNYAIVGAYLNDDGGNESGSAYIFKRSGATWSEESKMTASDADADDNFGFSVSISGDYAIIGSNLNDDIPSNSGSVYIFE